MSYNKKTIFLLNLRLILTIGFVLALIISFVLTYNEILTLKNKKNILSQSNSQIFSLLQSTLVLIIAILFLYINYNQFIINKNKNINTKDSLLQIEASFFALLSALVSFYVIIKNYKDKNYSVVETENI